MIAPWLTTSEFLAASEMSLRTFRRKCSSFAVRREGKKILIASASLPEAALAKLAPLSKPGTELMRPAEPACAPAPLFAAFASGPGRRIVLTAEQERQAKERLHILQPLLDFCSSAEAKTRFTSALRLSNGKPVRTADDMANYLASTHSTGTCKVKRSALWVWKKNYEERGLEGLARKVRDDKGRSKWAQQFPGAADLVAAVYSFQSQSKQNAYDTLVRELPRLKMRENDLPSYAAVCDYLATLPAAAVVWGREGECAHHTRMDNHLQRRYTDVPANAVWVADTMIHDVLVRDDCFNGDNAAIRPQLTALMDLRSRKLVGYSWVLNGSSRSIGSALSMAVRRYGPSKTFYCDNGKDFKKVAKYARPANWESESEAEMLEIERIGTLRMLGIAVTYCIPFRPQSKPIERFFRTLHLGLDAQLPHYTSGNAYERPDRTVAAAATHGKLLKMQRADESPLIPASHFIRMAQIWIEEEYNARHHHRGQGMDGRTPDEVFNEGYPVEQRRFFDLSILDTMLWKRSTCKVARSGFTANKRRYVGATAQATDVLYLANETEVIFCCDPNTSETGIVTDKDGRKLCDVRAQDFAPHSAEAAPMIASTMQETRGRRNAMVATVRLLRKNVAAAGHQTFAQTLHERALLLMDVNEAITQPVRTVEAQATAPKLHSEDIGDAFAAQIRQERYGS